MTEIYKSKHCLDPWNFKLIKHYAFISVPIVLYRSAHESEVVRS
jgi:hypothetical protein